MPTGPKKDEIAWRVPLFSLARTGRELEFLSRVLDSGWLTSGPMVERLELGLRSFLGCSYAVAVSSCTAALHLALRILGIRSGDEVVVPTLTFCATAEAVCHCNAIPVLADIDPRTGLLTPAILEDTLNHHPKVKCIIVVHYAGHPSQMLKSGETDGIVDICKGRGVSIVEDCAHAFGAHRWGQHVGTFGDIGCFSLYANKCITSGEGGFLVTHNAEYARQACRLRLHGLTSAPYGRRGLSYDVEDIGHKYNMSDLNAAVALAQLEHAEAFRQRRQRCAMQYSHYLGNANDICILDLDVVPEEHSWHLFPVLVRLPSGKRDLIVKGMANKGVQVGVHYRPVHQMTYYGQFYSADGPTLAGADYFSSRCLSLPIFPDICDDDVSYVCQCLVESVREQK